MTDIATPPNPEPEPRKPRRGKRRLVVLAVSSIVIVAGGAGAAMFLMGQGPAEVAAAEAKPIEHGLLSLEPFVVNLADPGGSRFLRVSVRLIVGSPEEAVRVQKNEVTLTRIRSAILEVLTEQTADPLVTADGKTALKRAIATRAQAVLDGATVTDVLFSDVVVQF